jgi:hypothetical protein
MQGYCMKCKAKKEMQDVKPVTMKNGKPANEGVCPDCGTKIFKIGAGDSGAGDSGAGDAGTGDAETAPAKAAKATKAEPKKDKSKAQSKDKKKDKGRKVA